MPDYITRAEFEAAIEMLQCRGDDQTIQVDHTPGGQTIRSTQVLTEEAASDDEYITVSYDSVAEEFTVTITDLPYYLLPPNFGASGTGRRDDFPNSDAILKTSEALDKTFTFNKPSQNVVLYVGLRPHMDSTDTDKDNMAFYWTESSGNLVGSDSTTTTRKVSFDLGIYQWFTRIFQTSLYTDGTSITSYKPTQPVLVGTLSELPQIYVNTSSKQIVHPNAGTITYSEPYNKTVYIGVNSGGNIDFSDDTADLPGGNREVGEVEIDSGNVVRLCSTYKKTNYFPPFDT